MREETVARNYAETLFALAERHEGVEAYQDALAVVVGILNESPQLRTFLATPRIAAADKKAVLRAALEGRVPRRFLSFVLVAVDKRRQALIEQIALCYNELLDEHRKRVHVEVTVARALDDASAGRVTDRLSRLLGRTAIPHFRIHPEILGGVVVRAGDTVYDGSLRRRLEGMRHSLLAASLDGTETINGGGQTPSSHHRTG